MGNCAGVDWASEKHDVIVAGESGEELLAATFVHDERGRGALCRALVRMKVELVAIERPDGVLIERLLDAGLRVIAIHPNQVAATRSRFRAAGGKSDRFDAFVLCELARTDSHRFRVLEPDSDATKALRALTRAREDLVHTRVALGTSCALSWSASGLGRSGCSRTSRARSRWRSSSVTQARSTRADWASSASRRSSSASATGAARHGRSCSQSSEAPPRAAPAKPSSTLGARSCSRSSARWARSSPRSPSSSGRAPTRFTHIPTANLPLVLPLPDLGGLRRDAALRDRRLPRPLPSRRRLAGDAGQAPVAIESGKRKIGAFRWRCDHRLRSAFGVLSDTTRHWHPWAQDRYADARARGHDHPRAIRTLGRAWSRVLWRCWQDRTPYDPARHGGLQRHTTVTIPTPLGPRPDLTASQRMAGAAVTQTAARRAERAALDSKPTTANPLDT